MGKVCWLMPWEFNPGKPPASLLHTWYRITMLSKPGESIPEPSVHRAKERPWEIPAAPWERSFAGKGSH